MMNINVPEEIRTVQGWMALDLHVALGHEVDHHAENQGFRSWADWWSSLCAEVRQLNGSDNRPLDI